MRGIRTGVGALESSLKASRMPGCVSYPGSDGRRSNVLYATLHPSETLL
jgi:hypothetical protein